MVLAEVWRWRWAAQLETVVECGSGFWWTGIQEVKIIQVVVVEFHRTGQDGQRVWWAGGDVYFGIGGTLLPTAVEVVVQMPQQ